MAKTSLQSEIKKSKPFDRIELEVYLNLIRTADTLSTCFATLFREHGISDSQYNVMRILRGAGEPGLPCLEVAGRMITRLPDITRLVDRLETASLVRRARLETDRRVVLVAITEPGLTLLEKLDGPILALHVRLMKHMSAADLTILNDLLVKVRQSQE